MLGSKIKLDEELLERCKRHAQEAGYSCVEEFVTHVLERALRSRQQSSQVTDEEEIAKRLRGLGYIE